MFSAVAKELDETKLVVSVSPNIDIRRDDAREPGVPAESVECAMC